MDYVALSTDANAQKLIFLVDSEAHISIIKKAALNKNFEINTNDIIYMKGITSERQKSIGSAVVRIKIKNIVIEHKFYVVDDSFPMPSHGIVGKEFLKRHRCNIDYDKMSLSIRPRDDILIKAPIHSDILDNRAAVPPNSEVFRLFKLTAKTFPCVVEAQNVTEHIAVPTTIATSKECWIRVLNTTDDMQIIDTSKLRCTNINDYNI